MIITRIFLGARVCQSRRVRIEVTEMQESHQRNAGIASAIPADALSFSLFAYFSAPLPSPSVGISPALNFTS